MTELTLGISPCPNDVFIFSGLLLNKIEAGLPAAVRALSRAQGPSAARAIMTTDPFPKEAAVCAQLGEHLIGAPGAKPPPRKGGAFCTVSLI